MKASDEKDNIILVTEMTIFNGVWKMKHLLIISHSVFNGNLLLMCEKASILGYLVCTSPKDS